MPTKKKKQTTTVQLLAQPALVLTEEEQKLLQKHHALKLQIELVPSRCFGLNIRSIVTRKQWDNIRKHVYQKANFVCEICGGKGTQHPVECHEVWIYDDIALIQRLSFFQALCPMCHEVKHYGNAASRGYGGRAIKRFETINQLFFNTSESENSLSIKIVSSVVKQWQIRSRQQWKLDISLLQKYGLNPDELNVKVNSLPLLIGE